jgi:asparagine synthase (glutamine-hydrolysing)
MCAIAGILNTEDRTRIEKMLEVLKHRGPDDTGIYHDPATALWLGHRRLSILDLSAAGHQPMSNDDESVTVVFNGELYNYLEIKKDLQARGYTFHSTSDTEILIHGYSEYGADIFKKIDGMWAVALYDKKQGKVLLSRDPTGIKPLYYHAGKQVIFASEIGAIASILKAEQRTLRQASIAQFLVHGYIYGNDTIYNEVKQMTPGTVMTYSIADAVFSEENIFHPQKTFKVADMNTAVSIFDELFSHSVRSTLQSDVPVGLFLSGGIDSALIGYEMQKVSANLTAFTIGFAEQSFNESDIAARIAKHLGFKHVIHTMQAKDIVADIDTIFNAFGQPFADTSALPTFYLSKLARSHGIKVVLGGDGADELFGGYPTHYLPPITEVYRRFLPAVFGPLVRTAVKMLPTRFSKLGLREKILRFVEAADNPYDKAHARWKQLFTADDLQKLLVPEVYAEMMKPNAANFDAFFQAVRPTSQNKIDEVMKIDFLTFLPNSCLVKSDISSMQHGLEIRVPFLNKDSINFAWFLPTAFKASAFKTKKLLRQVFARHLPKDIARMKKQGFVPPLSQWLLKELKPKMLEILSEENIAKTHLLQYSHVYSLIADHLSMKADNSKKIWALMSLVHFLNRSA